MISISDPRSLLNQGKLLDPPSFFQCLLPQIDRLLDSPFRLVSSDLFFHLPSPTGARSLTASHVQGPFQVCYLHRLACGPSRGVFFQWSGRSSIFPNLWFLLHTPFLLISFRTVSAILHPQQRNISISFERAVCNGDHIQPAFLPGASLFR